MPLRTRILLASVLATGGVAILAGAVGPQLPASSGYPWRAATVFAAVMAIAAVAAGRSHPFARFGPANHVTMARAALVGMLIALLPERATDAIAWFAVGVTACLAAMDGLDGWLARRTRMASAFGARFDVEIDALLILVLSVFVWRHGKAGAWVLACGLMRYLFVAAGWVMPWLAGPLSPTRRGKSVAVAQFAGLGLALAPVVPAPASAIVAAITLAALVWSFGIDVGRLWRAERS